MDNEQYWLPIFFRYLNKRASIEVSLENGDKLKGKVSQIINVNSEEETLVEMEVENRDRMWNKFTFEEIRDVIVLS